MYTNQHLNVMYIIYNEYNEMLFYDNESFILSVAH